MQETVAVVGGGIVGLAHAWMAARRGAKVHLFERGDRAEGASVRNFGMVWPIGQPNGPLLRTALRSRELWQDFLNDSAVPHDASGSLHLAYRPDEWEVLSEFASLAADLGYACELRNPDATLASTQAVNPHGLLGGLYSPSEMCVDPREVIAVLPHWLRDRHGVELHYSTAIVDVDLPNVRSTEGRLWRVDRAIVAGGAEFQLLYPEVFRQHSLSRCKLQMLRTAPQPNGWRMGPMLAGGLTLRHYPTFRVCGSLRALRQRVAEESPELDQFGVHVMASQNMRGEVVLGDSHEHGVFNSFDQEGIFELILDELRRFLVLPDWTIAQRWHGVYATKPGADEPQFVHEPAPGVMLVCATGGCGMTMSFGLAEQNIARWIADDAAMTYARESVLGS